MLDMAHSFLGKFEWNTEALLSVAVADSLKQCQEALQGEEQTLTQATAAHVKLCKKVWRAGR